MKQRTSTMVRITLSLALVAVLAINSFAGNAPRITKEELRQMLDNPEVMVADVRIGKDWKASEYKIKGAVRVDPRKVASWASQYGQDKIIVFY